MEYSGLNDGQVHERLMRDGANELPSQKPQTIVSIFVNVIREPMLLLLLASASVYFLLGAMQDALMLVTFVFVVIGITFYQEKKTEKALDALKNLASPRALVIRNGTQIRIPGREVVMDDMLVLREGDRVPADATVLSSSHVLVDESLLTGESLPVRKSVEDLPFVFSGTLVTQGRGVAKVTAIGINTQMGKIGTSLQTIVDEDTLLKKEIGTIVRTFAFVGIILCLLIVILYGLTKEDWLGGVLSGLTLSMAMLPEEFPVVLLIFLALGAWRMSKKQVLTRKKQAIETLGAATVLCVDKTGTLTLNRMRLTAMMAGSFYRTVDPHTDSPLAENYHQLFEYAMLSSQKDPFDPLEKEIKTTGERYLSKTEHMHKDWRLVKEYPLSKELLSLSHVWESPDRNRYVIAAKGAPEAIADLCHMSTINKQHLQKNIQEMSHKGMRIIGVAKALFDKKDLPGIQHEFPFEYVGLLGFTDPLRVTVPEAVKECCNAGIRVMMITGDYPGTARYIAKQAGLKHTDRYITGLELQTMSHDELRSKINQVTIFARVVPEQKLTIVNALKANGEIVAMTGDGVNDAPALKSAHIGIAMGERGTDVAREASDLVLLNDDFSSIVSAIRLGRRVFDNLQKAIAYIFSVHIPIAGMSLFPILFHFPIVLFPAHIAFFELIIDPACSTVFESEKEEPNSMLRPPRHLNQPLFDRQTFVLSLLQGLSILTVTIIVFLVVLWRGSGDQEARSLVFITMVLSNLMLIVTNLSKTDTLITILRHKNKALYWVIGATLAFLLFVLYVPYLRTLFHFSYLHLTDWLLALTASFFALVWFDIMKLVKPAKITAWKS